jgi:hypothetical protein
MAGSKTQRRARRPTSGRKPHAGTVRAAGAKRARKLKKFGPGAKGFGKRPTPVERAYVRARQISRETGKAVRFVVAIRPDGAESVTAIEEGSASVANRRHADAGPSELDRALAGARRRGQLRVAEILDGPEMLSADAFAERLGTTRATVTAWRHKNRVLGLEGATRGFRFPEWQVGNDGKPFAGLPELFDRFDGDAWAVYRFLVQRHPELGNLRGEQALRRGRIDEAVDVAESVARGFV